MRHAMWMATFVTPLGLSLTSSVVWADVIDIDDFSGNETVIDFTDVDMDGLGNPAEIGFGITVSNDGRGAGQRGWRGNNFDWSTFFDNIPGASLGKGLADQWGASDLTYILSEDVNRFGLLLSTAVQTTWTVSVFDTNVELIAMTQAEMPGDEQAVFVGYESPDRLIGSINIADVDNLFITIMDDVRFELSIPCPWDLDGSGDVSTTDLLDLLAQWGTDPGGPPDLDGDGNVSTLDLLLLLANWGPCPK